MTTENAIRHAYTATLEYLDQAEAHLAGNPKRPPDAKLLLRIQALPGGTILHADFGEDQHGPLIAVKIKHDEELTRLFDPWCIPPIHLEEIAGIPLRWHRTVQKGKVYLRLMLTPTDRAASLGIPVARAIANTQLGMATLFARGHKDATTPFSLPANVTTRAASRTCWAYCPSLSGRSLSGPTR
jgi:hypothetical protein